MDVSREQNRFPIERAESGVAAAITTAALALHAFFLTQAGPLWRDEICGLNLANSGAAAMWRDLQFDAFPAGWFLLLRAWTAVAPAGDLWFRLFGVIVGTALIAVVWLAGRSMTGRPPLIAMALLLLDAGTVRFGDSLRGYGTGLLLGVLVYWSLWRLGRQQDRRSFWMAVLVSIAAVHIHYYNAIVVFASCAGAATQGATSRSRRGVLLPLAVGVIAATTMIPYLSTFARMREWNHVVKYDIGPAWLHWMWQTAHAGSGRLAIGAWDLALVAGLVLAATVFARRSWIRPGANGVEHHAVAFIAGAAAYAVFLVSVSYYMAPWYYLTLSLLVAITVDALVAAFAGARVRVAVIVLALVYLGTTFGPASAFTSERLTNADIAADDVAARTKPGDLVIVAPWAGMISWARYDTGRARAVALPPLGRYDVHRFDLYLEALDGPAVMNGVLAEVDATLARGSRVLVVRNVGGSTRVAPNPPRPRGAELPDLWKRLETHLETSGSTMVDLDPLPKGSEYESFAVLEVRPADASER